MDGYLRSCRAHGTRCLKPIVEASRASRGRKRSVEGGGLAGSGDARLGVVEGSLYRVKAQEFCNKSTRSAFLNPGTLHEVLAEILGRLCIGTTLCRRRPVG